MKAPLSIFLLLLLLALTGCKGRLALLGLSDKDNAVQSLVDEDRYQEKLVRGILHVEDSVLDAAERTAGHEKKWQLQLIAVGVGLNADVGVGPFRLGVTPGVRAFFTNTPTPPPLP